VRIEARIPVPLDTVRRHVREEALESLRRWDSDVKEHRVHKKIADDLVVFYAAYYAPVSITEREFVTVKTYRQLDDRRWSTVSTSINHSDFPKNGDYVRGVSHLSGWLLTAVSDSETLAIRVVQVDVKGWIPSSVINLYKKKGGESMQRFCKHVLSNP